MNYEWSSKINDFSFIYMYNLEIITDNSSHSNVLCKEILVTDKKSYFGWTETIRIPGFRGELP